MMNTEMPWLCGSAHVFSLCVSAGGYTCFAIQTIWVVKPQLANKLSNIDKLLTTNSKYCQNMPFFKKSHVAFQQKNECDEPKTP